MVEKKELYEEIAELKEDADHFDKQIEFLANQNLNLEAVLRELHKKLQKKNIINAYFMEEQLEKLDSQGKTEKKGCFNCGHLKNLDCNNRDIDSWEGFSILNGICNNWVKDPKTEKKEDSETLKKIKQLAHAESEFYNKHGYFSFWSDKLKAQRIKEMILLKHLKDHKKVSEDQRKGIDIKKLFNEFDKANDELIKNLETEKKEVFDNVCICGHTDPAHDPVECKYCDCTEYKKDPIKNEMVTRKKTENKCKICGEKSPNEDGFCSSECFEKAQWESKEKPCNRCDHLIENINKYGHFYCFELDMKMDEFVEKCVHSTPKKKDKDKGRLEK